MRERDPLFGTSLRTKVGGGSEVLQNCRTISYYIVYDMIRFTKQILNYKILGLTL